MVDLELELGLGVIVSTVGCWVGVVVIIGWVGLGYEALCGNGKVPSGILGLWLISSAILQVGLGVVVWGGLDLWLIEGYGGRLFWYGGIFNSIRGIVDLWPEVGLCGIGLMVPVL